MDNNDQAMFRGSDGTINRFYKEQAENAFQSQRLARPVYDEVVYVEVITPGSKESVPVFELSRTFIPEVGLPVMFSSQFERFKAHYNEYVAGNKAAQMGGTPLESWARLDGPTRATLKHLDIFTIDVLAEVPDNILPKLGMGGRELREGAKAFLSAAAGNAPSEALASELVVVKSEVERLQGEVQSLDAQLTAAKALIATLQGNSTGSAPVTAPPVAPTPAPGLVAVIAPIPAPLAPVSFTGGNSI